MRADEIAKLNLEWNAEKILQEAYSEIECLVKSLRDKYEGLKVDLPSCISLVKHDEEFAMGLGEFLTEKSLTSSPSFKDGMSNGQGS